MEMHFGKKYISISNETSLKCVTEFPSSETLALIRVTAGVDLPEATITYKIDVWCQTASLTHWG